MEDQHGEMPKVGIACVIETDLVLRQSQLFCDSNHRGVGSVDFDLVRTITSLGPSMGHLHDGGPSNIGDQLGFVVPDLVVVGVSVV